jgi:hypothetical protein
MKNISLIAKWYDLRAVLFWQIRIQVCATDRIHVYTICMCITKLFVLWIFEFKKNCYFVKYSEDWENKSEIRITSNEYPSKSFL